MTVKQLTAPTTIRIEPEIKTWLLQKAHIDNRSLSNLINTILKKEKEGGVQFSFGGQKLTGILSRYDTGEKPNTSTL